MLMSLGELLKLREMQRMRVPLLDILRMLHEVFVRKLLNMLMKMLLVMLMSLPLLFGDLMRVTLVGQSYVAT